MQKLYEIARADGAEYIVTFDTDAQALRRDWLAGLGKEVAGGAALAGVWRDERPLGIEPYVHPSCLCTTVGFVERHGLRFDDRPVGGPILYDTLSKFTRTALAADLPIHKLRRSNTNELHYMLGGIYGDTIYHHGAGSRLLPTLGSTDDYAIRKNRRVRDLAARMLFEHRAEYFAWLRGEASEGRVHFVLGMHSSGTSCLNGCLEQAGLFLGSVERRSSVEQPYGTLEQRRVMEINDALLASAGGSWDAPPPAPLDVAPELRTQIDEVVRELETHAPAGLKDPRLLLTLDPWLAGAEQASLVGTFRHPEAMARSLGGRDQMPAAKAYSLWLRYNQALVERHRVQPFPLIEFDLADCEAYCLTVAALCAELGLRPEIKRILAAVEPDFSRYQDSAGTPVAPECAATYEYLREHHSLAELARLLPESEAELESTRSLLDLDIDALIGDLTYTRLSCNATSSPRSATRRSCGSPSRWFGR